MMPMRRRKKRLAVQEGRRVGSIAVIPARGGSKGLPGKNVRLLCGKPMITWTIEAARQASAIDQVFVSTDDDEIENISRRFGAEVVRRPKELSGDRASSESALLHTLDTLGIRHGTLAFLQCTSPLTLPDDIDGTMGLLMEADCAFTGTRWFGFVWKKSDGGMEPVGHSKSHRPRRQDLPDYFLEVGAVYAMHVEGFLRARSRFFGRTAVYEIPPDRCVEVDDLDDFARAETLMRRRLDREKRNCLPRRVDAVVLDFDGVLTDNRVSVDGMGNESVSCHKGDGWAIAQLKNAGIPVAVLTNEHHASVQERCRKLMIECITVQGEKLAALKRWFDKNKLEPECAVYVGNDQPDVPCMKFVGCGVAPQDAYPVAKAAARIILETPGGGGCVRELYQIIFDES